MDLDRFKEVNDRYGHDAGDEVLLRASARLASEIRPQDTLARLGDDEFALVAPRIGRDALSVLARRLDRVLAEPILIRGDPLQVRASVGAYLASPGESVEGALRRADQAMYAVKRTRNLGS